MGVEDLAGDVQAEAGAADAGVAAADELVEDAVLEVGGEARPLVG